MLTRYFLTAIALLLAICSGNAVAQQTSQTNAQPPDISGTWTGTWGIYSPAQGTTPPKDICKKLDAKVQFKDGVWLAEFEGDFGRP